jgi:hypothetical protein
VIRTLLVAALVVGSGIAVAHAEGTVVCGFILKKNGASIGYNLAVEPGNSRAVEVAFYNRNDETRHLNGNQPNWYISKSPNGGRNYTYGPDSRYVISVAPGSPQRLNLQSGAQVNSWNAALFVNNREISRPDGFCMVPVAVAAPSVPPASQLPDFSAQQPSVPSYQPAEVPKSPNIDTGNGDLGAAFDANQ